MHRLNHFFAVLFLAAIPTLAAEFFTGQAARMVIGQRTFTAQGEFVEGNYRPSAATLGGTGGVAYANNILVVTDSNRVSASPLHHRALVYRNIGNTLLPINAIPPQNARCPACRGTADIVLGQTDFSANELRLIPTASSLRSPTGVATDGTRIVIADTDNNRVMIWNSIPSQNNQPADIVLGQESFTVNRVLNPPSASSLRAPQGVWIQGNRLFVADSLNHRVLIWNTFPTRNGQAADVVLGQDGFNSRVELDILRLTVDAKQNNLLNPVSVSSDGTRLFVSDLGFNRVLIWNSIPSRNTQAADVVIGQPDFTSSQANNVTKLCTPTGKDADGNDTYPRRCASSIEFPRAAISDGTRLFVADGGNDRILVYNQIPTTNGAKADIVLGQPTDQLSRASDSAFPLFNASTEVLRSPMSLAWDGRENLFVADPYSRRVLVFSPADQKLGQTGVRNAASLDVFATGTISFSGTLRENDELTLKINGREYKQKVVKDDTFRNFIGRVINQVNTANDPDVSATPAFDLNVLVLTARVGGEGGDAITFETTLSPSDATLQITTSGATLSGGQDAARIAPGSIVTILGDDLAETTAAAPQGAQVLPKSLGGVEVFIDGIAAGLFLVSPTRINAQMPWQVMDSNSVNAWVRITKRDGRVVVTNPIGVPIIPANPGIFAVEGQDPRPGIITHYSSFATGTVSVDGGIAANDVATVVIRDRAYSYTVKASDTTRTIRDALVTLINEQDPEVEASASGLFSRIRLRARIAGPEGNTIPFSARSNDGAQVIMSAFNSTLCCANAEGALVTQANPAVPGETLVVTATGLGIPASSEAIDAIISAGDGGAYRGPANNEPGQSVSSLAGGKTAQVLFAGLKQGFVGLYEVHLELNADLPTNSVTQLTIAQDVYVSNVVTFPLKNPADEKP